MISRNRLPGVQIISARRKAKVTVQHVHLVRGEVLNVPATLPVRENDLNLPQVRHDLASNGTQTGACMYFLLVGVRGG